MKLIINILFVSFVSWAIGLAFFSYKIFNYKIDNETKVDAIVVLTGGRNRIPEAVNLLNKGLGKKLLISGVEKNVSLDEISQRKDVNINTSREIVLDKVSLNTVENAIESLDWIKKNNIQSIRLVTSNYHIPRSLEEFKSRRDNLKIIINPVYSEKVSREYWKNWGSFALIASEYNKFLYAYVRNILIRD